MREHENRERKAARRELVAALALTLLLLGLVARRFATRSPASPSEPSPTAGESEPAAPVAERVSPTAARPSAPSSSAAPSTGTTILVLSLTARHAELVASSLKSFERKPSEVGELTFCVEDSESGEVLARGAFPAPALCACSTPEAAHASDGCVTRRHEAVVRLAVPHRRAKERVRISAASGAELGVFELGAKAS